MKYPYFFVSALLALTACTQVKEGKITNFDECVAAGNPVMESYPEQCRTPDGKTFVRDIGNELEKSDLIRADSPRPGEAIGPAVKIRGEARGTWFFEGNFPIVLKDDQGNVLATHYATAQGEWMTEEFVPFSAEFEAHFSGADQGELILKKANPSDLREFDDELRIPVKFDKSAVSTITLFFYSQGDLSSAMFDNPVSVTRTIPKTPKVADAALRALFAGPTEGEYALGAHTTEDLFKLGEYYLGVNVYAQHADPSRPRESSQSINNVAVVNFREEALSILNSAAARQFMAKSAIETTLRNFPTIDHVLYSIDGELFYMWDA